MRLTGMGHVDARELIPDIERADLLIAAFTAGL
jgi:hypothetical protein